MTTAAAIDRLLMNACFFMMRFLALYNDEINMV